MPDNWTHGRPTVCDHCGGQLTPHVPGELCLPCRGKLGLADLDDAGEEIFAGERVPDLTAPQTRALRFFGTPQPRSAHPEAGGCPRWDVVRRLEARGLVERVPDPTIFDHRLTDAGRAQLVVEAGRRGWSLPWHRQPYVGDGADGARRSAEIDRDEADTLEAGTLRHAGLLASADRWDAQAAELESEAARRRRAAPCAACVAGYPCTVHDSPTVGGRG